MPLPRDPRVRTDRGFAGPWYLYPPLLIWAAAYSLIALWGIADLVNTPAPTVALVSLPPAASATPQAPTR